MYWELSDMTRVLSQFSAMLSAIVHFKLDIRLEVDRQLEGTSDVEWLHFLNQFSTVRALHVSKLSAGRVALALESLSGEMVAEVLSCLELICLEDQPTSSVEKFVAARRLSGRPVTVICTEEEFDRRLWFHVTN